MNITFGICTTYEDTYRLQQMIASIDALKIPHYEIIVIGGRTDFIPHLSSVGHLIQLPSLEWITVKKNLIAFYAHYDVLCLAHDYFVFSSNWYQQYKEYGDDWDVCSNPQMLIDGKRHFTDWVTWDDPFYGRYYSLPYSDVTRTQYQYVSGGFLLVKRDFLRQHPFNEQMVQGMPEDVEWSLRIRDDAKIRCNPNATVYHNKIHRDVGKTINPVKV